MKNLFFIIIASFTLPCYAQGDVNPFSTGLNEGVTYTLPDTRIDVTISTACITKTPGEFSRYAERYLRMKNSISKPETYWEMKELKIETSGKPNPEKMYTIKLANNSTAGCISVDSKGIIAGINIDTEIEGEENTENSRTQQNAYTPTGKQTDASQYMTEEMLQATSTAKLAELTAKEIYTIRESKLAITRGLSENMPKDGLSMQLVLDELNKQERVLTEMFTGRIDTVYHSFSYTLEPKADCDTTKAVLFRFSRKSGVVDKDNLAGSPVYYSLKNLKSIDTQPAEVPAKKIIKKEGVCYNIPGRALFEIYTPTRSFYKKEISLAQLGTTEVLSKVLFNKNAKTKVKFDTSTGEIISIEK